MTTPFRTLPSVDKILSDQRIQQLMYNYSRTAVLDLVRSELNTARKAILDGIKAPPLNELIEAIRKQSEIQWCIWPRPVINATGVILHTNMGRAPLSRDTQEAIRLAGEGYTDLELNLDTGMRGLRQTYISRLLSQLTGAQGAIAVNNNASAMLLGLASVANGKEVIVSRGQAVEIGGGFRIPEVLNQTGATLVEVGTTNRTYVKDFSDAITDRTGAILAIHPSNFRITGFTKTPEIAELVELGNTHDIPVLHDLGSGCLLDTTRFGLAHEPMPQESVKAGISLVFFSGDKLLGGPQAGILLGNQTLVDTASRHPLSRALRIDKLNMAGLAATLLHYLKEEAIKEIPVWQMIVMPVGELEVIANQWQKSLGSKVSVVTGMSTLGGGSLPGEILESWVVRIKCEKVNGGATGLATRLRKGDPPVVGRIEDECLILDPRTVLPNDREDLLRATKQALGERPGSAT